MSIDMDNSMLPYSTGSLQSNIIQFDLTRASVTLFNNSKAIIFTPRLVLYNHPRITNSACYHDKYDSNDISFVDTMVLKPIEAMFCVVWLVSFDLVSLKVNEVS